MVLCTFTVFSERNIEMNFSAVNQNYVSEPINEYVILGNDAIMKCSIPSFMSDFISVVGWTDNSGNEFHVQSQEHKLGKFGERSFRG